MATSVLTTAVGMSALSAVFVAILRFAMGAPVVVCTIVAVPAVVVSTLLALYLQWAVGVGLLELVVGTGIGLFVFAGGAAAME